MQEGRQNVKTAAETPLPLPIESSSLWALKAQEDVLSLQWQRTLVNRTLGTSPREYIWWGKGRGERKRDRVLASWLFTKSTRSQSQFPVVPIHLKKLLFFCLGSPTIDTCLQSAISVVASAKRLISNITPALHISELEAKNTDWRMTVAWSGKWYSG